MYLAMLKTLETIRKRLTRSGSTARMLGKLPCSEALAIGYPSQFRLFSANKSLCRQFFHSDDSDVVGLLCIARALEGGESDIVSSHHLYNVLQAERPDVVKLLTEPIWYVDRKGERSSGEEDYIRTSVFYLEPGENGRVYTKCAYYRTFISPIDIC